MLKTRKPLRARKPMNRGKGMRSSLPPRVRRRDMDPPPPSTTLALHRGTYSASTRVQPAPKENAIEHEGYRRLIAAMPCIRCGIQGYTQVCHTDFGKGMGLKTDDRGCWPGCGPRPSGFGNMLPGCHYVVGTSGLLDRETRRALEKQYAEKTQRQILAGGKWPKDLPLPGNFATGEAP